MYAAAFFATLLAAVSAAPLEARSGDSYTFYSGNGSPSAGWPAQSAWVKDFATMWSANEKVISGSCSQFAGAANPSTAEMNDLKSAITSVSQSTGVDPRFVLAIVMQESKGCVRVWTTNYGVVNPGLMQDHDGSHSCNTNVAKDGAIVTPGQITNPCPASEITGMIQDGAGGTSSGDGLKQILGKITASGSQKYYEAARTYNAGSIPASGDLGAPGATRCYASDVANRLTGWVSAQSKCTLS